MFWQDDEPATTPPRSTDEVVDVAYAMECTQLPVDHAYALSHAIQRMWPWFAEEDGAGLHTIHVAASGNGWMRPEDILHPSRRTRLKVRLPKRRLDAAAQLSGVTLDVSGYPLRVGTYVVRPLDTHPTLFARYVVADANDETEFLTEQRSRLKTLDVHPKKMLAGIQHEIATPGGALRARSLMLADLGADESVRVQQHGLGTYRWLGCGVFIPHKDIRELT